MLNFDTGKLSLFLSVCQRFWNIGVDKGVEELKISYGLSAVKGLSSLHLFILDRFEGVSWSQDEELIAYVAEESANSRPVFGQSTSSSGQSSSDTLEAGTWKGQGDWMEDWGESYSGKRRPVLFVANVGRYSGVRSVPKSRRYQRCVD